MSSHLALVFRRLLKMAGIVLAVVVLNFLLIRLAPGDPVSVMAGEAGAADAAFVQQLRQEFGLDKPVPVQLWRYVSNVLQMDLGYSYRQRRPVIDLIEERLPATLYLTGAAFGLSLSLGIVLGVVAASAPGGWTDRLITIGSLCFYVTPTFWVGLMFILIFSIKLGWLPPFGMESLGSHYAGVSYALDVFKHLILPASSLGVFYVAIYARVTRTSMNEVRGLDFVKFAKAKGLPPGRIMRVHVLRNALLPVITLAGIQAGQLVGGAVLVETVFAWPGIGRLAFEALLQRDYPVLLGVFLATSGMVVVFNLITDIVYTFVDPRIERLQG